MYVWKTKFSCSKLSAQLRRSCHVVIIRTPDFCISVCVLWIDSVTLLQSVIPHCHYTLKDCSGKSHVNDDVNVCFNALHDRNIQTKPAGYKTEVVKLVLAELTQCTIETVRSTAQLPVPQLVWSFFYGCWSQNKPGLIFISTFFCENLKCRHQVFPQTPFLICFVNMFIVPSFTFKINLGLW